MPWGNRSETILLKKHSKPSHDAFEPIGAQMLKKGWGVGDGKRSSKPPKGPVNCDIYYVSPTRNAIPRRNRVWH